MGEREKKNFVAGLLDPTLVQGRYEMPIADAPVEDTEPVLDAASIADTTAIEDTEPAPDTYDDSADFTTVITPHEIFTEGASTNGAEQPVTPDFTGWDALDDPEPFLANAWDDHTLFLDNNEPIWPSVTPPPATTQQRLDETEVLGAGQSAAYREQDIHTGATASGQYDEPTRTMPQIRTIRAREDMSDVSPQPIIQVRKRGGKAGWIVAGAMMSAIAVTAAGLYYEVEVKHNNILLTTKGPITASSPKDSTSAPKATPRTLKAPPQEKPVIAPVTSTTESSAPATTTTTSPESTTTIAPTTTSTTSVPAIVPVVTQATKSLEVAVPAETIPENMTVNVGKESYPYNGNIVLPAQKVSVTANATKTVTTDKPTTQTASYQFSYPLTNYAAPGSSNVVFDSKSKLPAIEQPEAATVFGEYTSKILAILGAADPTVGGTNMITADQSVQAAILKTAPETFPGYTPTLAPSLPGMTQENAIGSWLNAIAGRSFGSVDAGIAFTQDGSKPELVFKLANGQLAEVVLNSPNPSLDIANANKVLNLAL